MSNIVDINSLKKQKPTKMIVLIIICAGLTALAIWNYLINNENVSIDISESSNITFDIHNINSISPNELIEEINNHEDKPVLLHLYAVWCSVCKKQMPIINEAARKFQNTNLKVIIAAIDREMDHENLSNYLKQYGDIYFRPKYFSYLDGLSELLRRNSINYQRKIPFTAIIYSKRNKVEKFGLIRNQKYLDKKIMEALLTDD